MTQQEQVINVMTNNGGFATLGFLNQHVNVSDWKTKTPFASIRRIVQNDKIFFKIKPGLWALSSHKDEVLSKLHFTSTKEVKSDEEFNHTYYQGLIAEIGNLKGLKTYVPNQDKNKIFLNKPLKDITSIENIYEFTYPEVLKRAKTVDVIWFNERNFPSTFFEVEHSTDFQNSFSKFTDLQDFYCDFFILSTSKRKKEFEHKINFNAFRDIKDRVKFMDYDYLSSLHSKTFEYFNLEKIFKR
jgi:hypothetical protein